MNECGALVEWYLKMKICVYGEKTVSVPFARRKSHVVYCRLKFVVILPVTDQTTYFVGLC